MNERSRIYRGRSLLPCHRPVLGRICFDDRQTDEEGAVLQVCTRLPIGYKEGTVGLLWVANTPPPMTEELPLLAVEELPRWEEGQIALLDPHAQRLTVCPDLAELKQYTALLSDEEGRVSCALPRLSSLTLCPGEGCLVRAMADLEGLSPQQLLDAGRITVLVPGGEQLSSAIRHLYLLGIFGGFALLFGNILTEEDQARTFGLCHQCFCELTAEGREFNGYLPKGLLVDTPLTLSLDGHLPGVDFFCFDYPVLCQRMGGKDTKQARRLTERQIEDFLSRHPQGKKAIILRDTPEQETLQFVNRIRFDEVFVPEHAIPFTRGGLIREQEQKR